MAMSNKHGKGKYWFKSGCPTPDPRWSACQQLMIGPIPGDVEYSTLRYFFNTGSNILFVNNIATIIVFYALCLILTKVSTKESVIVS